MPRIPFVFAIAVAAIVAGSAIAQSAPQTSPAGKWQATEINGATVATDVQSTLEIAEDGKSTGSGGCNNFTGMAEFSITAIAFGPLAGTKKACPEPAMKQEADFHKALEQVKAWKFEQPNHLLLLDGDNKVVVKLAAQK